MIAANPHQFEVIETTIDDVQAAFASGVLTAQALVRQYLARIERLDQNGPQLRSIIELNPDVLDIAAELDAERASQGPRGPLHGIPILLKDNIDTADRMATTAGSLALLGSRPVEDATTVRLLRAAGAVILGKTNLSEWANFRSSRSSSGWSARGGQSRNPYRLSANPCGSSSGSATAIAANLAVASLGTETDGSIVCPAHANGVVGIKPTVGLTSRAGVIPVALSQDSVGPFARTVRDAAIVLGAITGSDPRDPATAAADGRTHTDYTPFLDPQGLRGARIGVPRAVYFGYSSAADAVIEDALRVMREHGATIVDPADIPSAQTIAENPAEYTVLLYEFQAHLQAYLATRVPDERYPSARIPRSLQDVIAYNLEHADTELYYFGQERFIAAAEKGTLDEAEYRLALVTSHRLARDEGINAVMDRYNLDALIAPTGAPAWPTDLQHGNSHIGGSSSPAAMAGYPLINVPAGYVDGLPVGISFMGRAYSEPTLIRLAYAFEQATRIRRPPPLP